MKRPGNGQRWVAVLLALALLPLGGGALGLEDPPPYSDIAGHWAREAIEALVARAVLTAHPDTPLYPDESIGRGEFIAMIVRSLGMAPRAYRGLFVDATAQSWYAAYIQTAYDAGLLDEALHPDRVLSPQAPLTREVMASLLMRAYGKRAHAPIPDYVDRWSIAPWALSDIARLAQLGIVPTSSGYSFGPGERVTRAEAMDTLYRVMKATAPAADYGALGAGDLPYGNDIINLDIRFKTTDVGDSTPVGAFPVLWESYFFGNDASHYDHDLAKTSLALSAAAYASPLKEDDPAALIRRALMDLRFSLGDRTLQSHHYTNYNANDHTAGHTFAHRTIWIGETPYDLIVIVVRGSHREEWYSNFYFGEDQPVHMGFDLAATDLLANLDRYMGSMDFQNECKLWITGHSRGAAVANIVAARLTDSEQYAVRENIYAYTFATPNVALLPYDNGYENIFNIVNPQDFVAYAPLPQWGYWKHGKVLCLPSYGDRGQVTETMEASVRAAFTRINGGQFRPFDGNEAPTVSFAGNVYALAPTVEDYYHREYINGPNARITMDTLFYDVATVMAKSDDAMDLDTAGSMAVLALAFLQELGLQSPLAPYLSALLMGDDGETRDLPYGAVASYLLMGALEKTIHCAHMPETYMSWMEMVTPRQLQANPFPVPPSTVAQGPEIALMERTLISLIDKHGRVMEGQDGETVIAESFARYPQLLPESEYRAANELVRDFVMERLEHDWLVAEVQKAVARPTYWEWAYEHAGVYDDAYSFTWMLTEDVGLASRDVFSCLLEQTVFIDETHPYYAYYPLTVRLDTGERMTMRDLLYDVDGFATYAVDALLEHARAAVEQGTLYGLDVYGEASIRNWQMGQGYFTQEGYMACFDPYEIGSFADGSFLFLLPYGEWAEYLNDVGRQLLKREALPLTP